MREIKLSCWEDFEAETMKLFDRLKAKRAEKNTYVSDLLFRGQANACWPLRTTLERYTTKQYSMKEYFRLMQGVQSAVESHTPSRWELEEEREPEFEKAAPMTLPGYGFMVHLRQYGFPSPLLDWSQSPYVAAFFAFREKRRPEEHNVAIFSYLEWLGGNVWDHGKPRAFGQGPYVRTDPRHFSQQSQYTYCVKLDGDKAFYCDHEEGLRQGGGGEGQAFWAKYTIPISERSKVLERLYTMNINAYSLFHSEESLMEKLAYQEIERKPR